MKGDVENATTSLEILEESSSERKLKFFRTMNLYVHNLVECLREKVRIYETSSENKASMSKNSSYMSTTNMLPSRW